MSEQPTGSVAAAVILGMTVAAATGVAMFALLSSRQALRELDELRAQLGLQAPAQQAAPAPVQPSPRPAPHTPNGKRGGVLTPEIVIDPAAQ